MELSGFPFTFGVCIYGEEIDGGQLDLYVTDGAIAARSWNWRRFRYFDTSEAVAKLRADLIDIFQTDRDVEVLGTDLDSPYVDNRFSGNARETGLSRPRWLAPFDNSSRSQLVVY